MVAIPDCLLLQSSYIPWGVTINWTKVHMLISSTICYAALHASYFLVILQEIVKATGTLAITSNVVATLYVK